MVRTGSSRQSTSSWGCSLRVDFVKIFAPKVQSFSHSTDVGIVQVRAVEVIAPVHQTDIGEDEEIDLQYQVTFRSCGGWCAPYDLSELAKGAHSGGCEDERSSEDNNMRVGVPEGDLRGDVGLIRFTRFVLA